MSGSGRVKPTPSWSGRGTMGALSSQSVPAGTRVLLQSTRTPSTSGLVGEEGGLTLLRGHWLSVLQ